MAELRPLLGAALLLAASCESEPIDKIYIEDIGDPCRSVSIICLDDERVQQCIDEVWTVSTCEVVCAELGPAYIAEGCDDDCLCVLADPSGCTPGESVCADTETIEVCDETQTWEATSCVEVCDELGQASAGCEPASEPDAVEGCVCTLEGTACEESSPPLCADEATLASCVEGLWVFDMCDELCGGAGTCDPLTSPHSCACE